MGQRSDNFLHAFDGWTLDWNRVFGLGFSTAPKEWVSVFRECCIEELTDIARGGVTIPTPDMRHPEMRLEMELLDRFRPESVINKGVSRLKAIYATPTAETPHLPIRNERAILEMRIDPSQAYVGEMDFIMAILPFMTTHRRGMEKFHAAFRRYWDSVIPLSVFMQHYRRFEADEGAHWIRKRSTSAAMPHTFFRPEVLIMSPVIPKEHVRIIRWDPPEAHMGEAGDWWNDTEEIWGEV